MMHTYLRLLRFVRPYLGGLILAVVLMSLLSVATMLYAFMSGPLVTSLISGDAGPFNTVIAYFPSLGAMTKGQGRFGVLRVLPLFLLSVALVKGFVYAGQFYLVRLIGQKVIVDLRNTLFAKVLRLSPRFHQDSRRGDLLSRFVHDVSMVEASVTDASADLARNALQVVGLVIQSFFLDLQLAAIAFIVVPVTFYPISKFSRYLKRVAKQSQASLGTLSTQIHEALGGVRMIQIYGAEERSETRFHDEGIRYLQIMRNSIIARGIYSPIMEILGVIAVAMLLWYASARIIAGELSPAHFLSFLATVFLLYGPIKAMSKLTHQIVTGVAAAERIFEVLDAKDSIVDAPDAKEMKPFATSLRFVDVHFSYPTGDPVLRGVNIEAKRGQVVALVGSSGAGKSTIAHLLPRFYDVTGGSIEIDAVDIRKLQLTSLRKHIALVSQDVVLFDGSVRDNVAFARPEASDDEVWAAIKAAHASQFVQALEQKLDTRIGEQGTKLSGGQRQRLAIARAILADKPILILDEATSALDTESERAVQAALDNLLQGRTALVIAHRLSTVRHADEIVVLDEGQIIERGSHDDLLAQQGTYARLYAMQFDSNSSVTT